MPTLRDLRVQARLSVSKLARLADLDRGTVDRAEKGEGVRDINAYAILAVLNQHLGTSYTLQQIDGLVIL